MRLIDAASAEFERVVSGLPQGSWGRPTLVDVSVRDLVEHVVIGNRLAASWLGGVSPDRARAETVGDQLGSDPLAAVAESCARQAGAFAAADPEQVVPHPQGDIRASAFLRYRAVDLVVHAWDLLRAVGQDDTLDRSVVRQLWWSVEGHLPEMLAFGSYGDGPTATSTPDESEQGRLLRSFGRRP